MATDTSKIWKEDKEDDELQKTMKVATAKMQLAKQMKKSILHQRAAGLMIQKIHHGEALQEGLMKYLVQFMI